MAFPVPSHLPRKSAHHDVSTKILSRVDEATSEALNSQLAASWLIELEETIHLTKERIHARIHADLPYFEQQLASSKSVQTRLQSLTNNVNDISDAVDNPETGIIPALIEGLSAHRAVLQESLDAHALHEALSHLFQCSTEYDRISSLVEEGKLPEAVGGFQILETLIAGAPKVLSQSQVMQDLMRKFRAMRDRIEEQLAEAYSRSISVSSHKIIVCPSVQIRQSAAILSLKSILASLSPTSITSHLTTLRRDLTAHYIEHILEQPTSITITSTDANLGHSQHELTQYPAPPNTEHLSSRLGSLTIILDFLAANLFTHLPESQRDLFLKSLCKPITAALLDILLVPSLPSSFDLLPGFLNLVQKAIDFEQQYVIAMLGNSSSDQTIKFWATTISGHYEKKRRQEILDRSRFVITRDENQFTTFRVAGKSELPNSVSDHTLSSPEQDSHIAMVGDTVNVDTLETNEADENGWDFEDDLNQPSDSEATAMAETPKPAEAEDEPDAAEAWGWNDDEEISPEMDEVIDENAWDDPWDEEPSNNETSAQLPIVKPVLQSPKQAKRLEQSSAKNQARSNGHLPSVADAIHPPPTGNPHIRAIVEEETYAVSGRAKQVIQIIEGVMREGHQLSTSHIFPVGVAPTSTLGGILFQSASEVLDLFRALYPVKFSAELSTSPKLSMCFSNDCLYLSEEVNRLEASGVSSIVKDKLTMCKDRLTVLADTWFDDIIERQRSHIDEILSQAQGFADTTEQDRYDECESAVNQVLKAIRHLSQQWKIVLTKSKYYSALGSVVDAALSCILEDVLALPDIPEVESHRLSELCRILNALEGLFVEDPDHPSVVVAYVPLWLKFSYLSELLEANMADISYLFEEGALVDFDVDELVKLVRALFADTPLRGNTINKLMTGHPVH